MDDRKRKQNDSDDKRIKKYKPKQYNPFRTFTENDAAELLRWTEQQQLDSKYLENGRVGVVRDRRPVVDVISDRYSKVGCVMMAMNACMALEAKKQKKK